MIAYVVVHDLGDQWAMRVDEADVIVNQYDDYAEVRIEGYASLMHDDDIPEIED